jgi:GNAT superfamily N-acetyltransferase
MILGQLGAVIGALYLLHRLATAVSGGRAAVVPYALMAQPVGGLSLEPMSPSPSVVFVRPQATDSRLADMPRPLSVLRRRLGSGDECHAAYSKGEFAGMIWIARGRYEEDEVRCTYVLDDRDAAVWDYDVYVAPRYRLGRTMSRLWHHVDGYLAAQGVRWTLSRISLFNPASLSSHSRLGARRVGTAVFFVAGTAQLMLSSSRPFLHLSRSRATRPSLTVRAPQSPANAAS